MNLVENLSKDALSVLQDPFNYNSVIGVHLHAHIIFGKNQYWGNVEFKNGNTHGEQRFDGTSLTDVILQVDAFIKSLP